ncbi:hypothetical protein CE91St24_31170 [Odoribacteraceae bacterium]|nr:hypothetical protein CE91St21_08410 [Odoribacteraceae bacterium]GKH92345.1 hypothetical protein CE91St23_08410 [Odoribacteraceae bacterium]GKH96963.1 hypothetical protein CE91St22_08410 [Odoribacteraceae bacterium]GKI03842.1 hypothetical protein CE91St24_31170 [Odoribacteraceae bacterium]
MALYEYSRFKIRIDPGSKKRQGLHIGDVVRRQYVDGAQTFYSLMVVLATGEDSVLLPDGKEASSPYFIGALIEGHEPRDGELLDFVRLTSLTDERRSGAMYLTASDEEAPYMDVIDGMGTERSLCRPASLAAFGCSDNATWSYRYLPSEGPASRIIRIARSADQTAASGGLHIPFSRSVSHPQRLVISFRIRASKALSAVPLRFGYADGTETDGQDTVDVTTEWQYRLCLITVDFPAEYACVLAFDLSEHLDPGDWCEVGDLNVCLSEHLSSFSEAAKIRIGRITGIADPLFGMLQGYGAYFQRLYATRDVHVAGTLTAGDEEGFGSTFYAGRIHKNCIIDSLNGNFTTTVVHLSSTTPTGIGKNILLPVSGGTLLCQKEAWTEKHAGERYCLSFWCYCPSKQETSFDILHGEKVLASLMMPQTWQRVHIAFDIEPVPGSDLCIDFRTENRVVWFFSSPQLEKGSVPTLYQPTDDTLNETDEYGAWFCRGGVGGTIQHPLLRLEPDGSIRAGNDSFVINPDGSGYFSGGRFRWNKDTIILQDVTIRWEDLDEEMQEQMRPRFVSVEGGTVFHYPDAVSDNLCDPAEILLTGTAQNLTADSCRWEYLAADGGWKDTGGNSSVYTLTPDFPGWEGRNVLTLRFVIRTSGTSYHATHTVSKQYDGSDSYSLHVESDSGTVFRNHMIETTLRARLYKAGTEITDRIPDEQFLWSRISDDAESDALWNAEEHRGRTLRITGEDVWRKAVFNCEVLM